MDSDSLENDRMNYRFERNVAIIGACLMIFKFVAYFVTNSVSVLTDALESIVNVIAGVIGTYSLWLAMRPADSKHPYGSGKIELISSSIEGILIVIAGVMIIYQSILRLITPVEIVRLDFGLFVVFFAAAVNFGMGYRAIKLGRKNNSMVLEASGKHLCSDTYSSIGIFVGLVLIKTQHFFGYHWDWLDPQAAIVFGVIICYTGLGVIRKTSEMILDAQDKKTLIEVTRAINHSRVPELIDIHHLRVVRYGSFFHLEAHIIVPDYLTQKEITEINAKLTEEIQKKIGSSVDITIQQESCEENACNHCQSKDCKHRKSEFRHNLIFDLDTVTSAEPLSVDKPWPYNKNNNKHKGKYS